MACSRTEIPRPEYARTIVGLLFFVNVVGLTVGALAFGRHVVEEHERLILSEIILIWAGDEEANRLLRREYRKPWVHP